MIIETERLILREYTWEDFNDLYEMQNIIEQEYNLGISRYIPILITTIFSISCTN